MFGFSFSKAATCSCTIFFSAGLEKAPPRVIVTFPSSEEPSLPPPQPDKTKATATTRLTHVIQRRLSILHPSSGYKWRTGRKNPRESGRAPFRRRLRPGYVNPRQAGGFHRLQGWIATSQPEVVISSQVRVASPARSRLRSSTPCPSRAAGRTTGSSPAANRDEDESACRQGPAPPPGSPAGW